MKVISTEINGGFSSDWCDCVCVCDTIMDLKQKHEQKGGAISAGAFENG